MHAEKLSILTNWMRYEKNYNECVQRYVIISIKCQILTSMCAETQDIYNIHMISHTI